MSEIKLLDINTINKIAAGEVVDRPSSVVKELVENSIDAGATSVSIEIEDGGTTLIRITDNGSGISKSQVKTAFVRHATSKIQTINDINNVMTLGFRGEALPSIASVSQMELVTRTSDDAVATKIEVFGGNIVGVGEAAAPVGTSITVRSLFYNVPARKKFLKKNSIEAGQITELANKMALGNINVSFKYTSNGNPMLHTSGKNSLEDTIFNVYGKETAQRLIKVNYESHDIKIIGVIGKPDVAKANRLSGNLYINGRLIKSDIIQSAIEEAYKTRVAVGKFPLYVLNIQIQAENIDVNVHPSKLEVRFHNEDLIFQNVFSAISDTLQSDVLIPDVKWGNSSSKKISEEEEKTDTKELNLITIEDLTESEQVTPIKYPIQTSKANNVKRKSGHIEFPVKTMPQENKSISAQSVDYGIINEDTDKYDVKPVAKKTEVQINLTENTSKKYSIVGQVFNTYWIATLDESMYMIDQHAAHERILYEEALQKIKSVCVAQHLLQPLTVRLSPIEFQTALDKRDYLENLGFEYDEFGNNNVAIRALPVIFKDPVDSQFFLEIINMLINREDMTIGVSEKIATIACKAAIKGNRAISQAEAKGLIEKLLKMENPFSCPHGRPTILEMKKSELEKNFKRIL